MYLFIAQKEKENKNKRNIKLRKIDKRKRKMFKSKCTITYREVYGWL